MNTEPHILVTGGAGFIGSHLVERLLRDGHRVVALDDLSTGSSNNLSAALKHPEFRFVQARISDCAELNEIAANASAVYHLAATVGVDLVVQSALNVLESSFHETEVLLQAIAPHKVPLVLTSSSEVYGKSNKAEFSEDDDLLIGPPTCARWSYACSKLMDEFLALAYAREKNLPVVIARLFNTVGPRQTGRYGMVLPRFIEAAQKNQPLKVFGDGSQTRCFCFVDDVVESLMRLLKSPVARGEIFNIGSTEEISIADLARLVIELVQSRSTIEFVPYEKAYAPGFDDMHRRKPRTNKLAEMIGFKPLTSLQTTILRSMATA